MSKNFDCGDLNFYNLNFVDEIIKNKDWHNDINWKFLASIYPGIQIVKDKFEDVMRKEKVNLFINEFSNEKISDNLFILILNPFNWKINNPYRSMLIKDIEQVNVIIRSIKCDNAVYSLYVLRNIDDQHTLSYINFDNDMTRITDSYHFNQVRTIIEKSLNNYNDPHVNIIHIQKRIGPF